MINNLINSTLETDIIPLLKSGCLSHAIILECSDASLADSVARKIASYAVCEHKNIDNCECSNCKKALLGMHPDVLEFCPESSNKSLPVDVIRDIRKSAYTKPNEASCKVYILKSCDNMSNASANALLKILEEPPAKVMFILTCESRASLLDTIKSRCHIFSLDQGKVPILVDSKPYLMAIDILKAMAKKDESELLIALSNFGKDRSLTFDTIKNMEILFDTALNFSFGISQNGENHEIISAISQTFTKKALIYLIEETQKYQKKLQLNANNNLLTTDMCVRLYKAIDL